MTITRLSTDEAKAKLDEGFTYVDVRTEEEFEEGHPAGAVNVPLALMTPRGKTLNSDFVAAMNALFPKTSAKIILGCAAGVRSMTAAEMLKDDGWGELWELRPGWYGVRDPFGRLREKGWEASGFPIENGAPQGRTWAEVKKRLVE
jgi:rhodanese-related sulfurtransferase